MGHSSKRNRGFTLIELSIVLVIIGLVVGGVLVGRDLIYAAEIRAVVKQVEQFNAAVNTFRNKYNCLPGDCPNASDFGFDAGSNGNGDSYIGLCNASSSCRWSAAPGNTTTATAEEAVNFWYHLSEAGLIPDHILAQGTGGQFDRPGIATPKVRIKSKYSVLLSVYSGWGIGAGALFTPLFGGGSFPNHSFILLESSALTGFSGSLGVYAPADIQAIDSKMDDGLPLSGTVRAWVISQANILGDRMINYGAMIGFPTYGIGPGGPDAAVCVRDDMSPAQYNVQYTGATPPGLCGAVVRAAF